MPEEKNGTPQENPDLPLEDLIKKCMDAEGYVIFVGSLSNKTDEKGNRMLDFVYRRYHLSFEDTKTAAQKFKEALLDDIGKDMG